MFSTVLEIAGIATGKASIDGRSLLPLLRKNALTKRNLYWHYLHYSNQGGKPEWVIRQGDFKLIEFLEDGKVELYNLATDAGERANLVEQYPQKVRLLKGALHKWGKAIGAQHIKPNPA